MRAVAVVIGIFASAPAVAQLAPPANPFCNDCTSTQPDFEAALRAFHATATAVETREAQLKAEIKKTQDALSGEKIRSEPDRRKVAEYEGELARLQKALEAVYDGLGQARRRLQSTRGRFDVCNKNACFGGPQAPSPPSDAAKAQACKECAASADRVADFAGRVESLRKLRQDVAGSKEGDELVALPGFISSMETRLTLARTELENCRDEHRGRCVTVDSCLIGSWRSSTGIALKVEADGTQTVDYANMQPLVGGPQSFAFEGMSVSRISTASSIPLVKTVEKSTVKLRLKTVGAPDAVWDLADRLGPGALGEAMGNQPYSCKGDSLSYFGSTHRDRRPNLPVTLTRLKQ